MIIRITPPYRHSDEADQQAAHRMLSVERGRRIALEDQLWPAEMPRTEPVYADQSQGETQIEIFSDEDTLRANSATFILREQGMGDTHLIKWRKELPTCCPWCVQERLVTKKITEEGPLIFKVVECPFCGSVWTEKYAFFSAYGFCLGNRQTA